MLAWAAAHGSAHAQSVEAPFELFERPVEPSRVLSLPRVAWTGDGYFVVWHRPGLVLGARVSPEGELLDSPAVKVADVPLRGSTLQGPCAADVAGNGTHVLVAWMEGGCDFGDGGRIFVRRLTTDGAFVDADPIRVGGFPEYGNLVRAGVVGDRFVVVWSLSGVRIAPGYHLHATLLDADGDDTGTATVATVTGAPILPGAISGSAEVGIATWTTAGPPAGVFARRIDPEEGPVGEPIEVSRALARPPDAAFFDGSSWVAHTPRAAFGGTGDIFLTELRVGVDALRLADDVPGAPLMARDDDRLLLTWMGHEGLEVLGVDASGPGTPRTIDAPAPSDLAAGAGTALLVEQGGDDFTTVTGTHLGADDEPTAVSFPIATEAVDTDGLSLTSDGERFLAAWHASDGRPEGMRFDAGGRPLDASALRLGETDEEVEGLLPVRDGFLVMTTADDRVSIRHVDGADGSVASPVELPAGGDVQLVARDGEAVLIRSDGEWAGPDGGCGCLHTLGIRRFDASGMPVGEAVELIDEPRTTESGEEPRVTGTWDGDHLGLLLWGADGLEMQRFELDGTAVDPAPVPLAAGEIEVFGVAPVAGQLRIAYAEGDAGHLLEVDPAASDDRIERRFPLVGPGQGELVTRGDTHLLFHWEELGWSEHGPVRVRQLDADGVGEGESTRVAPGGSYREGTSTWAAAPAEGGALFVRAIHDDYSDGADRFEARFVRFEGYEPPVERDASVDASPAYAPGGGGGCACTAWSDGPSRAGPFVALLVAVVAAGRLRHGR